MKPVILFTDEPAGNLDYDSAAELIKLLQQIKNEFGQIIIMVTHYSMISDIAGRVLRIDNGVVKEA